MLQGRPMQDAYHTCSSGRAFFEAGYKICVPSESNGSSAERCFAFAWQQRLEVGPDRTAFSEKISKKIVAPSIWVHLNPHEAESGGADCMT